MSRVIVTNVRPPIPSRVWDWCAYHDDDVEAPWTYGWGKTREEALEDLMRLDAERAEYEDDSDRYEYETGGQS